MDKVSEDINHILAKWDPIRVGENIATEVLPAGVRHARPSESANV